MRRRALLSGGTAAIAVAVLPITAPIAAGPVMMSDTMSAVEWLSRVKALGYEGRRQYVALLRAAIAERAQRSGADKFVKLIDAIEERNEREGGF